MNETAAVSAIQTLIDTNKTTLVSGLTQIHGISKAIHQIERNLLAPPVGSYFYIAIRCTSAWSAPFEADNSARPSENVYYEIAVHIADNAVQQQGESGAFDTSVDNFRKLCDRIVKLLYDTKWYPTSTSSPRFRLAHPTRYDGRRESISKTNLSDTWVEGQQGSPMLYSLLTFTLLEHYADTSVLYS